MATPQVEFWLQQKYRDRMKRTGEFWFCSRRQRGGDQGRSSCVIIDTPHQLESFTFEASHPNTEIKKKKR